MDKELKIGSLVRLKKVVNGLKVNSKIKQLGVVYDIKIDENGVPFLVYVMFKNKSYPWMPDLLEVV